MPARPRWDIEHKILVPFLLISIMATLAFCAILYYSGYTSKTLKEQQSAENILAYISADIDYMVVHMGAQEAQVKYQALPVTNVYILDAAGQPVGPVEDIHRPQNGNVILSRSDNLLGWQISYIIDQDQFVSSLIEEQKYMILATIALLLLIVQSSILIAGNISTPVRRLSTACKAVSENPEGTVALDSGYTERKDEIGQLARSFVRMLDNIHYYMADIVRVKKLNETILESLPTAVVAYDSAQNLMLSNGAAKSLLARTEYRCEGRTLEQLLEDTLEHPELFYDPLHFVNADGKALDIELGVWRLTDENQMPWGVLCTLDDITYRKLLESRAQQDEKLVYAGKLAASLAHEIRNPLAGIRASVQVVARHLERPIDQTLCDSIIGEVDRVNLLVENLVDLTRGREMQKTLIQIPELFDELLLLYSKVADNSHIQMRAQVEGEAVLWADRAAMKQIFINLINNSIKAIQGGGEITLRAAAGEGELVLQVEDTGAGMSAQQLEELHRLRETGEGGGLGSSIVTHLVRQHGGDLRWQSAPGLGTTASLTFRR